MVLSSRSAKIKPQSSCSVTETTLACMSGDLLALALDYLLLYKRLQFILETNIVELGEQHAALLCNLYLLCFIEE